MMKKSVLLIIAGIAAAAGMILISILEGCSDPGSPISELTSVPNRVPVVNSTKAPPMNNPFDSIWDGVLAGSIDVGLSEEYTNEFSSGKVLVKAIKTPDRMYLRFEWLDATRSVRPNEVIRKEVINGNDTTRTWYQHSSLEEVTVISDDSTYIDTLWYDQDRVALIWDMGDNGAEGADCAAMCHASALPNGQRHYTSGGGSVDVWEWQAGNTDPAYLVRDGIWNGLGHGDDQTTVPIYILNFDSANARPLYMQTTDTAYTGNTILIEDAVEFDSTLDWTAGYDMPGYIINRNASGSVADISGYSAYAANTYTGGRYLVLMSRALTTGNADDIDFTTIAPGDSVQATMALMLNADRVHSGSRPFYFIFP